MNKFASISTLLLVFCLLMSTDVLAQKFAKVDKSPADIAYFRMNQAPKAKVIYSRPMKSEREVFGKLVPYDKVWRLGANEATEIRLYSDATFGGKQVKAGTYTMFAVPERQEWTIILNSDLDQWGAYKYSQEADVLRVDVPVIEMEQTVEAFSITFEEVKGGTHLIIAWENTKVEIPIIF